MPAAAVPCRATRSSGLIRTGRPVSVHRAECRVLASTRDPSTACLTSTGTASARLPKVSARLSVTTMNRPGSLGSISTVVGKQGANIVDLKIGRRTPEIYELLLDVEVGSVDQLQRVQAALRATSCVTRSNGSRIDAMTTSAKPRSWRSSAPRGHC